MTIELSYKKGLIFNPQTFTQKVLDLLEVSNVIRDLKGDWDAAAFCKEDVDIKVIITINHGSINGL